MMTRFAHPNRPASVRNGNANWYRIQNAASTTEVHVYDEIGSFGVTAHDFVRDLTQIKGPISLHLNSPGGEVFDGLAIYNALKQRGNVSITIDGLAASIASVISQAAAPGKLSIGKHASMMIHDGFSQVVGNAQEMRVLADLLDQQSDNIAGIYADRTGKPASFWRDLMKKETWYTGEQAVEAGLADKLVDTTARNSAQSPILNVADDSGWVVDPDGCVRFDPDGDGDDDAYCETDTDHGWWDENNALLKPIPPMPAKIREMLADGTAHYGHHDDDDDDEHEDDDGGMKDRARFNPRNASVDNSPWDAGKAWHNGAESDNPAAFYKAICAGKKSGDPSRQSSWALPYRYTPDSAPNAAAVRNALARLDQTEGLVNKDKARGKLQKLMKKINPDYESSNSIDPNMLQALFTEALNGRA